MTLSFLRTTDRTCIKAIDIPAEKVKGFELPLNKAVAVTITPAKAGVEKFHCTAMAMGDGKIVVRVAAPPSGGARTTRRNRSEERRRAPGVIRAPFVRQHPASRRFRGPALAAA